MATSEAAAKLEHLLSDQPHMPLGPLQLQEYQTERERLTSMIDGRDAEGNPVPWIGGNRAEAAKRRRVIDKTLHDQAPKPLGVKASEVYRLATEVIQKDVRPALLSHAVMNRSPAGAVGEYMRRESHPTMKRTILTVKRALRALDPTNEDPDLTNMDRWRSTGEGNGAATFDVTATIPGNFAMTPLAKENWPLGDPVVTTPLAQAQERDRLEAEGANGTHARRRNRRVGRKWTPEEKAEARTRTLARLETQRAQQHAPADAG